jgi:hypothetical protein
MRDDIWHVAAPRWEPDLVLTSAAGALADELVALGR